MASQVILLDYWPSPFAARVRTALAEKGIHYESKDEDLADKSPLLVEVNPVHQKVPVLIHNGKPICESDVIIQYLDDVWKDESLLLLPSDPYLKAKARFWNHFINTKVYESSRKVWMSKGADQEAGKKELTEWCKLLEEELGDNLYFGVETFGFVDISLVPFYNWFNFLKTFADFSIQAECPNLVKWGERCLEKESVSKSLPNPDQMYAAFLEFNQRLGI
ncbi:glutathione S-transferase U25-like [Rhododendron vialii]|uniref:glutathione S-transferase U25-like n=1 Tax=Rhododendron vialii TaxID=182163 RepID=UPI00265F03AB|nr:glutathione S-transferase U25-like [Rhododendron vialii]